MKWSRKKTQGFTLVELIVTIAIFAIVAIIAFPLFTSTLEDYRRENDVRLLLEQLNNARSKAAVLRKTVTLNLEQTTSSENSSETTADQNENSQTVLNWIPTSHSRLKSNISTLQFSPTGKLTPARTVELEVCDAGETKSQIIVIDFTGVARIKKEVGSC